VAYPPNKISKTGLKMQAFSACFMKFCLALNNYKKRSNRRFGGALLCTAGFFAEKGKT